MNKNFRGTILGYSMENLRLNKIKGQINGIEKMLADNRDCMDVMQQIVAVRAALTKLGEELLNKEMEDCLCEFDGDKSQAKMRKIFNELFKIT